MIGTAHAKTVAARFECRAASRLDGNLETHAPAPHMDMAHEFLRCGRHIFSEIGPGPKQHGVRQPDCAGGGQHFGHQDSGIFLVVVSRLCEAIGSNFERPAASGIQDAAKQRCRIELRHTGPWIPPSRPTNAAVIPSPISPKSFNGRYPSVCRRGFHSLLIRSVTGRLGIC